MKNPYFQIAQDCMINIKDEAEAIESYNLMAEHIRESGIPEGEQQQLLNLIREITDDELDHIRILKGIYTGDFEVEPDEAPEGEPLSTDPEEVDEDDNA